MTEIVRLFYIRGLNFLLLSPRSTRTSEYIGCTSIGSTRILAVRPDKGCISVWGEWYTITEIVNRLYIRGLNFLLLSPRSTRKSEYIGCTSFATTRILAVRPDNSCISVWWEWYTITETVTHLPIRGLNFLLLSPCSTRTSEYIGCTSFVNKPRIILLVSSDNSRISVPRDWYTVTELVSRLRIRGLNFPLLLIRKGCWHCWSYIEVRGHINVTLDVEVCIGWCRSYTNPASRVGNIIPRCYPWRWTTTSTTVSRTVLSERTRKIDIPRNI